MSAHEGEERLLTVFADVHYYFSAPSPRPLDHRFDKASYFYLYGDQNGRGGRIEVANHVGKPEQDAFTGSLDTVTIRQSQKHPTLCILTIDGYRDRRHGAKSPVRRPEHHWKLPSTDPRNERNLLMHLHTLDIYFWTVNDAESFLGHARRFLQPDQLEILDMSTTPAAHEKVMSPVVQQLENIAIQDRAYQNGQTFNSRPNSAAGSQPPATSVSRRSARDETPKAEESTSFQPLAYNPAAPAAPEPIRHREKTPPPVDDGTGTGLAAAAYADHTQSQVAPSRPSYGHQQSIQGYVGSPAVQSSFPSYTSSAPSRDHTRPSASATGHRTSSVSSFAPPAQQDHRSPANANAAVPSFAPPPPINERRSSPTSQTLVPAFSPPPQESNAHQQHDLPLESPAMQILGSSYVGSPQPPVQHLQPQYADYLSESGHQAQAPIGGYSNYQYNQPQVQQPGQANEYDIHSQVYRPTEDEYSKHKPSKSSKPGKPTGRLEEGAERVDKGVNRFFKKLEKRIG